MVKSFGRYTHAIVSRVPNSFVNAIGSSESINIAEARKELSEYTRLLRNLGIDVIELPADENFPDSVYVEDCAVVCNGNALICKPGHPARAKEVDTIRAILKKELNLSVFEIADSRASIDGGDVLFTGREFFVGISNRTNERGAMALASAFPEFPVTPIRVPSRSLHLKSIITMAGPDIMCIGCSPEAYEVRKKLEREATFRYATLTVRDDDAANVIYANGTLIYRSEFPKSCEIIEDKIDFAKTSIKIWELSKPKGALSCLSILIHRSKSVR